MWKNIIEPGRLQMTIWRMRIACCIPTYTNTHLEYVILFYHYNNDWTNAPKYYAVHTCIAYLVFI